VNIAKDLTDYQKSTHFSSTLKDSSVYSYQLHAWINRSKIRWQRDPFYIWILLE